MTRPWHVPKVKQTARARDAAAEEDAPAPSPAAVASSAGRESGRQPQVGDLLQTAVEWEERGKMRQCWASCRVTKVLKSGAFRIKVISPAIARPALAAAARPALAAAAAAAALPLPVAARSLALAAAIARDRSRHFPQSRSR